MNKLILYQDEEGSEYVVLCTSMDFHDTLLEDGKTKVIQSIDIEEDLTAWPTDRPLSSDFKEEGES